MKKISVIALIFILLTPLVFTLGYASADREISRVTDAAKLMAAIGVIDGDSLTEASLLQELSRADFASYIARLIKLDEWYTDESEKSYYLDMPYDHWGKNAVNALTESHLLEGDSNQYFRPQETITLAEAVKVLVLMLGYGDMAEAKGGYPYGYLMTGKRLNLIDNSDMVDRKLTRGEVLELLYYTSRTDINKLISVGEVKQYRPANGENILSVFYSVYEYQGQIKEMDGINIDGTKMCNSGYVRIGDILFRTDLDLYSRLGRNVRLFYRDTATTSEKTIVCVFDEQLDNNIFTVRGEDVVGYQNGVFTYMTEDGYKRRISVSPGVMVAVNGQAELHDIDAVLNSITGVATLISADGSTCDAIVIENYVSMAVSDIDDQNMIVYGKYNSGFHLNLDAETVKYYMESGLTGSFGQILPDGVISAAVSEDGETVILYICERTVTGVIESIFTDDGKYSFSINGATYELEQNFSESTAAFFRPGDQGKFVLDKLGRIAHYVQEVEEMAKYGFLIDIAVMSGFNGELTLRLMTQDGNVDIFEGAEKMMIDEYAVKSGEAAFENLTEGGEFVSQVVRYTLDADGKIKNIDTARQSEKESDYSLRKQDTSANSYKLHYLGFLGEKNIVDNNSIVFMVPKKEIAKEAPNGWFGVSDKSCLTSGTTYNVELYSDNPESLATPLVVVYQDGNDTSILQHADLYLFEEMTVGLDEDGFPSPYINLFGGEHTQYKISDSYAASSDSLSFDNVDPNSLSEGDCVQIKLNMENEVVNIRLVLDYSVAIQNGSEEEFFTDAVYPDWRIRQNVIQGNFFDGFKCSYGFLARKDGDFIQWGYAAPGAVDELWNTSLNGGTRFLLYDPTLNDKNRFYTGTRENMVSELSAYYTSDGRSSKLITVSNAAAIKQIVVYK